MKFVIKGQEKEEPKVSFFLRENPFAKGEIQLMVQLSGEKEYDAEDLISFSQTGKANLSAGVSKRFGLVVDISGKLIV